MSVILVNKTYVTTLDLKKIKRSLINDDNRKQDKARALFYQENQVLLDLLC